MIVTMMNDTVDIVDKNLHVIHVYMYLHAVKYYFEACFLSCKCTHTHNAMQMLLISGSVSSTKYKPELRVSLWCKRLLHQLHIFVYLILCAYSICFKKLCFPRSNQNSVNTVLLCPL